MRTQPRNRYSSLVIVVIQTKRRTHFISYSITLNCYLIGERKKKNLPEQKEKKKKSTFFTNKSKENIRKGTTRQFFSLLVDVKRTTTAVSSTTRDYDSATLRLLLLERKKKFLLGFFPRNRSLYYQSLEKSLESFLYKFETNSARLE